MIELAWPTSVSVNRFALRMLCDLRTHAGSYGGSENVVDMLDDRWEATVQLNWKNSAAAGEMEAFINRLSSGVYYTKFGHLARPTPFGTCVASTGTLFPALKGADTVSIQATTGTTLLAGDMLSIDGLLCQVAENAVSVSSQMDLILVNRLRRNVAAFSAVDLTAPFTSFMLRGNAGVRHGVNFAESVTLDFEEKIFG